MQGAVDLTGYHLSFDAEMTSSSDMQYFINHYNNGDRTISGNGEAEYYADYDPSSASNPFSFQNGALVITARPVAAGGLPYTSGLVSTGYSFYQNQGYFEVRAQLPSGAGFWPAFWMLSGEGTSQFSEMDVMEQPNNDGVSNYFQSIKTPTYNGGGFINAGVDLSAGYHTYGLMWTSNALQFTFDGNYVGTAVATPAALATYKAYMIANLAVGGYWAGNPATGATAQMKIDYIRAYSNDASVPTWWGGVEAISSPDGANTTPNLTGAASTTTTPVTTTPASTTPASTTPVATGTASTDTLTLGVSEDAYGGDAQYRVLVDGYYVDGTFTATASHAAGLINQQTISGSWGKGAHTVAIQFINDLYGGTSATDRNLYVNSVAYDGTTVTSGTIAQYNNGVVYIPVPATGTNANTLTLNLSEDAYKGDAQFNVSVDGTLVNTAATVTASHAAGATQAFSFTAGLSAGTHDIGLTFLNDLYDGSPTTDRNLYITGASLNGTALNTASWTAALNANGTDHFKIVIPS